MLFELCFRSEKSPLALYTYRLATLFYTWYGIHTENIPFYIWIYSAAPAPAAAAAAAAHAASFNFPAVVFTWNRPFYPADSLDPCSSWFLILKRCWLRDSDTVDRNIQKKRKKSSVKQGKGQRTGYENTTNNTSKTRQIRIKKQQKPTTTTKKSETKHDTNNHARRSERLLIKSIFLLDEKHTYSGRTDICCTE